MFSYLRHRRTGSTPASPDPSGAAPSDLLSPPAQGPDSRPSSAHSPISPYPPVLPPIPRVASQYGPPPLKPHNPGAYQAIPEHGVQLARAESEGPGIRVVLQSPQMGQLERVESEPKSSHRLSVQPYQDAYRRPYTGNGGMSNGGMSNGGLQAFGPAQMPARSRDGQLDYDRELPPIPQSNHHLSPLPSHEYPPPERPSSSSKELPPLPHQSPQPSQAGPPRLVRPKLNLRNPMSLLLRRRSGAVLELADESLVSRRNRTVPALPDDYDPRIIGKGVHDFSAPRPRRNGPVNTVGPQRLEESGSHARQDASDARYTVDTRPEMEHTPIFREHFDEDAAPETAQPGVRAEALANQGFISRNSIPLSQVGPDIPPIPERTPSPGSSTINPPSTVGRDSLESYRGSTDSGRPPLHRNPKSDTRSQKTTSSSRKSSSIHNLLFHKSSNASRFSFQLGSGDSARQERLLEERHKQKAAARAMLGQQDSRGDVEDEYDDDMYDMDGYDDFEEQIPGVNCDDDDEDELAAYNRIANGPSVNASAAAFSGMNGNPAGLVANSGQPLSNPSTAQPSMYATAGNALGRRPLAYTSNQTDSGAQFTAEGLGINGSDGAICVNIDANRRMSNFTMSTQDTSGSRRSDVGDDDFYFDDGLIGELDLGSAEEVQFDESIFDDPNHPLNQKRTREKEETVDQKAAASMSENPEYSEADHHGVNQEFVQEAASQSQTNHFATLSDYHSALADAATRAAESGRFVRHDSLDTGASESAADHESDSLALSNSRLSSSFEADQESGNSAPPSDPALSSRPSLIPSSGHQSLSAGFSPAPYTLDFTPSMTGFDDDDSDPVSRKFFDDYESDFDGLDSDPMIAAANAEALAYDSDGEYGREFGFYASSANFGNHTAIEEASGLGGVFAPRGIDPIGRNRSVREPNLTPITERSEQSTRNSFASLHSFMGGANASLPGSTNPGLAQLAQMSPYDWDEEEMTLDHLMRLRRGAFGTSQASLGSPGSSPPAAGSRGSSPVAAGLGVYGSSPVVGRRQVLSALSHVDSDPDTDEDGDAGTTQFPTDDMHLAVQSLAVPTASLHAPTSQYGGSSDSDSPYADSPTLTSFQTDPVPAPLAHGSSAGSAGGDGAIPLTMPLFTETLLTPGKPFAFPAPQSAPLPPPEATQPVATACTPPPHSATFPPPTTPRHERQGSGAESVSYVREADEGKSGEFHWVMERRRTAESGEMEVVGREIVMGGRI